MKIIIIVIVSFFAGNFIALFVYLGMPMVLGEALYPLASPLTILISSTIALVSALITVKNSNRHIREKNTIDVIGQGKGRIGQEFKFISNFLRKNEKQKEKALMYLAENSTEFKEMETIHNKLNELEHICEGMFKNFYDKAIVKNNRGATIIKTWDVMGPYLIRRRELQRENKALHNNFFKKKEYESFHWIEKAYHHFT